MRISFIHKLSNINEIQPRQGWISLIFTICVSTWDSLNITNLNDMGSFKLVIFRLSQILIQDYIILMKFTLSGWISLILYNLVLEILAYTPI